MHLYFMIPLTKWREWVHGLKTAKNLPNGPTLLYSDMVIKGGNFWVAKQGFGVKIDKG